MCFALAIPPFEFLTSDVPPRGISLQPETEQPSALRRKSKPLTKAELEQLQQILEAALTESTTPVSLKQLAQQFGCTYGTLRKYFPNMCEALVRQQKQSFRSEAVRNQIRKQLEEALLEKEPLSLEAIARGIGCESKSLRRYFSELSQLLLARYQEQFQHSWIERQLQKALKDEASALSLSALAQQLGYKRQTLRSMFPELCQAITARYHAEQKRRHAERISALCASTRQAVLYFHQLGQYPSSLRVLKMLGDRHLMLVTEVYTTWRETLEELGYQVKNYGPRKYQREVV